MYRYHLGLAALALTFIGGCATVDQPVQTAQARSDRGARQGALYRGGYSIRTINQAGAEEMLRDRSTQAAKNPGS